MNIPKKSFILIVMFVLLCSTVISRADTMKQAEINPYIGYEGLQIDVRNVYNSIPNGFAKMQAQETDYYIVKLKDIVKTEWRTELEQKGATILWYLPYNSYLVRMNKIQANLVQGLPFVYWVGVQQPYFKLSNEIRNFLTTKDLSSVMNQDGQIKLAVAIFAAESAMNLKDSINSSRLGTVISEINNPHNTRVFINVFPADFPKVVAMLANLKEVEGIEIKHKLLMTNDSGRWVHQRFTAASFPLYTAGIRGQNQIGASSDSGLDLDLCYFRDTVNGLPPIDYAAPWTLAPNLAQRKIILYNAMDAATCGANGTLGDDDTAAPYHGTHTFGSFVGNNFATACTTGTGSAGDGMALCAKAVEEDMGMNLNFINIPCGSLYDLLNIAYTAGARIHTDSWGYGCTMCPCEGNIYDMDARDIDQFIWEHKDMEVHIAAGNSGTACTDSTIGAPGTSKSCSTAGATNHGANATGGPTFSSRGWTSDKRMKPDFCAQGVAVVSALGDGNVNSNNCGTQSMSGTSMATPTSAGHALLVRQYYTDGYYPTGVAVPANGFNPSGALLKGTMINSAQNMTGIGGTIPGIRQGWGRLQEDNTLYFSGYAHTLWIADATPGLGTGFSRCYYVNNTATTQTLKITLTWSDYPGALLSNPALVNDLKLEVTNPGNTTTYNQTLDASYNVWVTTTGAAQDNRNTVEQIPVTTPAVGNWIIKVRGINVPQPLQPYALVVSGSVAAATQPAVPTGLTATAPAANQVTLNWTAATGATCYGIYRANGACPGTSWQLLNACASGTTYVDNTVSGGSTYAYKITAVYAASCESDYSTCASVTATGTCTLGPTFAGAAAVVNNATATCGLTVQWALGTSQCPSFPTVKYTVYKSTDPAFIPGPSNQLATCLTGTTYLDSAVTVATVYYYVVRAEDSRAGGGLGPCNSGNLETNTVKQNSAPYGPKTVLLTDNAGDTGSTYMVLGTNWSNVTTQNHTAGGTHSYWSGNNVNNACTYLTSPSRTLTGGAYYFLEYWTYYNLEYTWDGVDLQVSSNAGTTYNKVTPIQGYTGILGTASTSCIGVSQNAYTGDYRTWNYANANLAAYAGNAILFRFRLGTDSGLTLDGFWVDDLNLTATATCTTTVSSKPGEALALNITKSGTNLSLVWSAPGGSCLPTAYGVYRGTLPWTAYNHAMVTCAATSPYTTPQDVGSYYYLIVPATSTAEGSYGKSSAGTERPQGTSPCKATQDTGAC